MEYQPLIEHLVSSVVGEPDKISIFHEKKDGVRTYFVEVSDSDRGRLIGKRGNVITSMRYFVSAAAYKNNEKVLIKVV